MKQRIVGFDLARAYAIFGMFIVNFNFCFGSIWATIEPQGRFLNLFVGNSTAIFIILAGMGVSLMTNKNEINNEDKKKLKSIVLKRSWFLFALGLLLYSWWPGDILHFYGGYMHIAAFLLFVPKRYYLWTAIIAIIIFHFLLLIIPIETGWDFNTYEYVDFWTLIGFLRNTLYNGWNSIFPWVAYFMLGMWLGRLNWQNKVIKKNVFLIGLLFFITFQILRLFAKNNFFHDNLTQYILSEYFPPYLPFMVITASFALIIISFCMVIGDKFSNNRIVNYLSLTGKMTLTHYVIHLTLGMIILAQLTGKSYTGYLKNDSPTPPLYIFLFAILFFVFSVIFSTIWSKRFKNGPIETIMRKISN